MLSTFPLADNAIVIISFANYSGRRESWTERGARMNPRVARAVSAFKGVPPRPLRGTRPLRWCIVENRVATSSVIARL